MIELRRDHPRWGPRRLAYELERKGSDPVPSRSSIYRILVRSGLVEPRARRRKRSDYLRWERARPMELWQLDVMEARLADGSAVKILTGLDDPSRFCVLACAMPRATARPVCEGFTQALRAYGVPPAVLTDNGRVREAESALHLDPTLSEAHLALGLISQYTDWDWPATERHYRAAIELTLGDPTAHAWFAVFLARMGRVNEALAHAGEAVDLDPLGHEPLWLYQTVLLHLGRYPEALAIGRKAVAAHPRSTHTQGAFGSAYLGVGESDTALEWLARSEAAAPGGNPVAAAWRIRALAQAGRSDEARAGLQGLVRRCTERRYPSFLIAFASISLGDATEAIRWLKIAVEARDPLAAFANWATMWPLAEHPEYQDILRELGLPDLSRFEEAAVPARD